MEALTAVRALLAALSYWLDQPETAAALEEDAEARHDLANEMNRAVLRFGRLNRDAQRKKKADATASAGEPK